MASNIQCGKAEQTPLKSCTVVKLYKERSETVPLFVNHAKYVRNQTLTLITTITPNHFKLSGCVKNITTNSMQTNKIVEALQTFGLNKEQAELCLSSRDAIIGVIEKQELGIRLYIRNKTTIFTTPAQLCEDLLRATNKWDDAI